jgi:hypothetical protein
MTDKLNTIDDSELEAVSGGHHGNLAKAIAAGVDLAEDLYGDALQAFGNILVDAGQHLKDRHHGGSTEGGNNR